MSQPRPATLLAALLGAALLAAPGHAQYRGAPGGGRGPALIFSDPGEVVAAEIAFARLAREKGQWAAFRATAAQGAQMFAPQPVRVEEFLKGRAEAPAGLAWQPHAVVLSCDGAYAVSRGVWTNGARHGWFATVWQRQKDGRFKWVLDQGGALAEAPAAPEMISAKVADCPPRRAPQREAEATRPGRRPVGIPVEPFDKAHPTDFTSHAAPDGSLAWHTEFTGKVRTLTVAIRQGTEMVEVLHLSDGA